MAKKNLTSFANYCRDRDIRVLVKGTHETTVYFDVYTPRDFTQRKRRNFEKRIMADNVGFSLDIDYLSLKCKVTLEA